MDYSSWRSKSAAGLVPQGYDGLNNFTEGQSPGKEGKKPFTGANPYAAVFRGDEDTGDYYYQSGEDENGDAVWKLVPGWIRNGKGSLLTDDRLKARRAAVKSNRLKPQIEEAARELGRREKERHDLSQQVGRQGLEQGAANIEGTKANTGVQKANAGLVEAQTGDIGRRADRDDRIANADIEINRGTLEINRKSGDASVAATYAGIDRGKETSDTNRFIAEESAAYNRSLIEQSRAELAERSRQFNMDHNLARDVQDLNDVNGSRAWVMGNISNFIKAAAGLGA